MPYRLTKIYTRAGDQGFTHLGPKSVPKDDDIIEAFGTIDELNAVIGFLASFTTQLTDIDSMLMKIQNELFDLGGELYFPDHVAIKAENVTRLEEIIDDWNADLPPLEEFLLPRGDHATTACHIARTVCRRAERCLVRLHRNTPLSNPEMLRYLNRLSDLLFVLARVLGRKSKTEEVLWNRM